MTERKTKDHYQFPEFARGTFIEHLEQGQRQARVERAKAAKDFWYSVKKYFKR